MDTAAKGPEIVIVRRNGGGGDEGHHGGAWKIAYADFMTAMMALFLVLWLVNSTDKDTRVQVARYFNPVKLTDAATASKGLQEPSETPKDGAHEPAKTDEKSVDKPTEKPKEKSSEKADEKNSPRPTEKRDEKSDSSPGQSSNSEGDKPISSLTDEDMFNDPLAVLARIEGEAAPGALANPSPEKPEVPGRGEVGLLGGDAFRDPFDPQGWSAAPVPHSAPAGPKPDPASPTMKAAPEPSSAPAGTVDDPTSMPAALPVPAPPAGTADEKSALPQVPPVPVPEPVRVPSRAALAAAEVAARAEAEKIRNELAAALGKMPGKGPAVSVTVTPEGILISLTDTEGYEMFRVGSAVPRKEVITIMGKVAKELDLHKGPVIVRGHTDGRAYAGKAYDNWRLSSARAQTAYYMLVRAGLGQDRISRIEGHADRELKVPADPFNAQNRRIEVLVKTGTP